MPSRDEWLAKRGEMADQFTNVFRVDSGTATTQAHIALERIWGPCPPPPPPAGSFRVANIDGTGKTIAVDIGTAAFSLSEYVGIGIDHLSLFMDADTARQLGLTIVGLADWLDEREVQERRTASPEKNEEHDRG